MKIHLKLVQLSAVLAACWMGAQQEPFKGSLPIRAIVLQKWPGFPKLPEAGTSVASTAAAPADAACAPSQVLDPEQMAALIRGAQEIGAGSVVSRPRMEVVPGLEATITVGTTKSDGAAADGFSLASVVSLVEIPAGEKRHRYTMDLAFERAQQGARTLSRVCKVPVAEGSAIAFLGRGTDAGAPLLVCVMPGPDLFQATFTPDRVEQPTSRAQPLPLIEFVASIYRVDAPKDYGSPKGDGPRTKWAAYPGGATLSASELKQFLSDLGAKPGFALLSRPAVWVNEGQEASIVVQPEPDAPSAKQTICVQGTLAGTEKSLVATGSFTRSAAGMSTEGSWNKPRPIPPGGAIVWSIHDPGQGAWFTMVLQGTVITKENMPAPQTATGLQ